MPNRLQLITKQQAWALTDEQECSARCLAIAVFISRLLMTVGLAWLVSITVCASLLHVGMLP